MVIIQKQRSTYQYRCVKETNIRGKNFQQLLRIPWQFSVRKRMKKTLKDSIFVAYRTENQINLRQLSFVWVNFPASLKVECFHSSDTISTWHKQNLYLSGHFFSFLKDIINFLHMDLQRKFEQCHIKDIEFFFRNKFYYYLAKNIFIIDIIFCYTNIAMFFSISAHSTPNINITLFQFSCQIQDYLKYYSCT